MFITFKTCMTILLLGIIIEAIIKGECNDCDIVIDIGINYCYS